MDIAVRTPSDGRQCLISAIETLPDGRLIMSDSTNCCIKLVDIDHTLTARTDTVREPWGIGVIANTQVAVCLPRVVHSRLQFVIVGVRSLTLGHSINAESSYYNVKYCENRLLVIDNADFTIKILDMMGRILKTIAKCEVMRLSFAVNPTNRVLYVANSRTHAVACMNLDGAVLGVYKHEKLMRPYGVTIHRDGSLYCCSWDWKNVHHITSQCTPIEILLDSGEIRHPYTICCHPNDDALIISEYGGSVVKKIKLSPSLSYTTTCINLASGYKTV